MKYFPMFINTQDRRIIIVGGGEQAAQKYRLAKKTSAEIIVASPVLDDELAFCAEKGLITHHNTAINAALFKDTAMVFIASGCRAIDACAHAIAKSVGAMVNVVNTQDLCDIITPAIIDRDPVVVAIGTEGNAPVIARQIKSKIEQSLEPDLGEFVGLIGNLRSTVKKYIAPAQQRNFWRWVFSGKPRKLFRSGEKAEAMKLVKKQISSDIPLNDKNNTKSSHVAIVGAGPGAADMITLRGVKCLQEADVIFYDRLVDPKVLELARRDAERVFIGKTPNTAQWPQEQITALLVSTARQGKNIVRLKSGDPGIFSRGSDEVKALKENNISFEIVPGVTAAAGAAAALGEFLTDRDDYSSIVFSTGQVKADRATPDWSKYLLPGTTLALYMAVKNAPLIRQQILNADVPGSTKVQIVGSVGMKNQKIVETDLDNMCKAVEDTGITNPAIIFVRRKYAQREPLHLVLPPAAAAL